VIRAGCERAEVVATFDLSRAPDARAWLAEQALDDDGDCVVRRLIVREGRSRAFVNGRSASGNQLKELGELLVDIHGQHAHQSLLRPNDQRDLLDAYGGHRDLALSVATTYRILPRPGPAAAELEGAAERAVPPPRPAALPGGRAEALGLGRRSSRPSTRSSAGSPTWGAQSGTAGVLGPAGESEPAGGPAAGRGPEIAELSAIDGRLDEPRELIEGAAIHAREAASGLRHYLDGLDLDPARLDAVETRLAQIHDLARKYRVFPQVLPETPRRTAGGARRTSESGRSGPGRPTRRSATGLGGLSWPHAERLTEARRAAAERLGETVSQAMQQLGMAGGRLCSPDRAPGARGRPCRGARARRVSWSAPTPANPCSPWPGSPPGGELSRISLGIQVATAQCGRVPTLVFDEVDVGIGGGVAEIVGRLLRHLGEARQVLCVTHLPQVAAQAHQQLLVRKEALNGEVHTRIEPLDAAKRIEEIARMLGGTEITRRTRDHAGEMLGRAEGKGPRAE
jgi:DNA repair protein RecN (Recombination protein N)